MAPRPLLEGLPLRSVAGDDELDGVSGVGRQKPQGVDEVADTLAGDQPGDGSDHEGVRRETEQCACLPPIRLTGRDRDAGWNDVKLTLPYARLEQNLTGGSADRYHCIAELGGQTRHASFPGAEDAPVDGHMDARDDSRHTVRNPG